MSGGMEMSFEFQLGEVIDDLEGAAQGIALKVLNNDSSTESLSRHQLYVWNRYVLSALKSRARYEEKMQSRYMMECSD